MVFRGIYEGPGRMISRSFIPSSRCYSRVFLHRILMLAASSGVIESWLILLIVSS